MRTNDSFTLYAADVNTFSADTDGGFRSPSLFSALGDKYTQEKAEDLRKAFASFIDGYDEDAAKTHEKNKAGGYMLGSLIIGDDDAPSTIRFLQSGAEIDENLSKYIGVSYSNYIYAENSNATYPVSVTITAKGVVTNAELTIMMIDSEGQPHQMPVKLYITVESSAPYVKAAEKLPQNMVEKKISEGGKDMTIYEVALKYGGDPFEYEFEEFMADIDIDDEDKFFAPAIYEGLTYKLTNSDGLANMTISPVSVTTTSNLERGNKITIKAEDYIPMSGEYTDVTFRVSDAHGELSEEVTLRISIEPAEIEIKSGLANAVNIRVQSYLQYSQKPDKQVFDLVSDSKDAQFVYDSDVKAPSARYDVSVYAMLMKDGDSIVPCLRDKFKDDVKNEALLITVKDGSGKAETQKEIYQYIKKFFGLTVSDDGKTLTFVPNAANVNTNGSLSSISLYIEIGKRFTDGKDTVMPNDKPVMTNVTVENSKPVATVSDGLNYGYPLIDNALRNENFLEFSGYAGDSLTWKLCNPDDESTGLFTDYDMIRNTTGNEKLVFVAARLGTGGSSIPNGENILNEATKPNDPVLSVSSNDESGTLTVKINRKVKDGTNARTVIPVDIYVADRYTKNNYDNRLATLSDCSKTTIFVTVINSLPKFKEVED
ncbi:MAG: hypothetical protein K2M48_05295, partial [Clostridiales bacterium]|nr:hypothetical protein [Clostridiales bacterium]